MKQTRRSLTQAIVIICILSLVVMLGWNPVTRAQIDKKPGDGKGRGDMEKFQAADPKFAGLSTIDASKMGFIGYSGASDLPSVAMSPSVGADAGDESEPNNTSATATLIAGSEVRIRGNIQPNGDVDFFRFTAATGDRIYAAVMTSFSASASTDSQLRLIGSDGITEIEFDDDDGVLGGLSSTIAGATIPLSGTYYLRVNHFSATSQLRPYDLYLRVQSGAPTAEVEPNDTVATATALPAGGWVSGTRNPAAATEVDFYSFSLNAGDTVYLGLDLDPERDNVQWNGRLGVALFGDAANQILVVDDASTGSVANPLSEAMYMTVKTAGTYYAYVDSASAATGGPTATYNLSVSVIPASNLGVNCTTYTSTNVPQVIPAGGGLVSSTITVPGNPRIADLDVNITLDHLKMADIDAHLRSPAGNDNGIFTDIGATATGGQTLMDTIFDDEAGITPLFTVLKGPTFKPELNYRLDWFDGEDAGGTWTLDLRDDVVDANGGNLTAWSLRVCEQPPAGSVDTLVSVDFESGANGFTHSGTFDEWELGLPSLAATTTSNPLASFTTCNSGTNCWKTDLDATYEISSNQNLDSPPLAIPAGSTNVRLQWAMKYQMETATFDNAWVEVIEMGNPSNSRIVWRWNGATMTDSVGTPAVNIGASAGWGLYSADITSFAGTSAFARFHLDSDSSINYGGLAIDDVKVTRTTPVTQADLSVTKTDAPDPVAPGGNITYTINFANNGPDAAQNVTVTDAVPVNTTFVSAVVTTGSGWATTSPPVGGTGNVIFSKATVSSGEMAVFTVVVNVNPGTPNGTVITNSATAASTTTDSTPGNNTGITTTTVNPPPAVPVTISGRLVTAGGRGIANTPVTLTEANGNKRIAWSNSFGYFKYFDVLTQQQITISPKAKRYTFADANFFLTGNTTVTFTGTP